MPRGIPRDPKMTRPKLWRSKRYFTQKLATQDPRDANVCDMLAKCQSCGRLRMYHPVIATLPMVFPEVGTQCAFKWVDGK